VDELELRAVGIGEEHGVVDRSFNLWSDRALASPAALG
jgi:hypothetical protein